MKADTYKLSTLFGFDRRHVVPLFQRPYVWSRDKHWAPLWDDVVRVVDQDGPNSSNRPHFLGAVVLDQVPVSPAEFDQRLIIDGQQRFITLQVLIRAAQHVAETLGMEKAGRVFAKLVSNDPDLTRQPEDIHKVWPTNTDRAAFVRVMEGQANLKERNGVEGAFNYFVSAVETWVQEADESATEKRLEALLAAVRERLLLVVIDLEQSDDPQVIFETLNARGTPLESSDLIKNLLFQRALAQGHDIESLYPTCWGPFDARSWREEIRQGRLKRPRLDAFLSHYLSMRLGNEVTYQRLFPEFRGFVSTGATDAKELMEELVRFGGIYLSFDDQPSGSTQERFFERLSTMQATTVHPLLLHLLGCGSYSEKEISEALQIIESFLVRRMICNLTTKHYNRLFLDVLDVVRREEDKGLVLALGEYLARLEGEATLWPDDNRLGDAVAALPLYRTLSRDRLRMVLEALEYRMRDRFAEPLTISAKLTIEHLLPQQWRAHWPLPEGPDLLKARERREQSVHVLGNLTLLTKPLNSRVSNGSWGTKLPAILKRSALALNQDLPTSAWDEDAIAKRGRKLARALVKIWRGPERYRPEDA